MESEFPPSYSQVVTNPEELVIEWGFLPMGHFSRNYRELFGETPSETLSR
jgi:transcriptional regulator GlxA family with amidase domain